MQASLNASVNVSTSQTPHQLMFGVDLRMPWNLLRQAFVGSPQAARQDADEAIDLVYLKLQQGIEPGYRLPNRHVSKKLSQRYIKCRMLDRVGRLAYRLQFPPELVGAHPVVSVQHLERAPASDTPPSGAGPSDDEIAAELHSTFDPRFPHDDSRADVDMRFRGRGRGRRKQYLVRWTANNHLEVGRRFARRS
ncbi:hypothetical protein N7452_000705 [Penicillium brevicompactum]|uniref:Tf2-1-like SH3-like domain-containing protein n=1 Tax=Penicillium brevicompactum TaxID=5074 RepID=A0A9W9UR50_PENBR|nr:hypothetical protein N7452_000705 [Penicillium brevicompactum]